MPRLGTTFANIPVWARTQLAGLVAAMIVRRATGQDALYQILKDEADTLIEYYEVDPDEVYGMYGDPEDPAVRERARGIVEEGTFIQGSYLGIKASSRPRTNGYGICKVKNVDPRSPKHGTVNGFIYSNAKRALLHYNLRIVAGQFRTLKFDDECAAVESFSDVVGALEQVETKSDIRSLCIESINWDDVIDAILADIRGVSRGEARKRMAEVITEHRDRCFPGGV